MIDLFVYFLLCIGVPLPEPLVRPSAERLQLTDVRESWRSIDWPARCRECAALPTLCECAMLPPLWLCEDRAAFNSAHGTWLERRQESEPDRWDAWQAWRAENQALGQWWMAARDGQRDIYCTITRRRDLARVKGMTSPQDWAVRNWPPAAPIWRFGEP